MSLNDKQARFAEEYIIDLNATLAAQRAGYSEKTAYSQGQRLLKHVEISSAITKAMSARENRTEISQDRVLLEIARLAFSDPRKAFTESGDLKSIKDWPDEVAASISSIKISQVPFGDGESYEVKEVKFWDKTKSLDMAGRHLGLYNDKISIGGQKDNPLTVAEAPKLSKKEWLLAHGLKAE